MRNILEENKKILIEIVQNSFNDLVRLKLDYGKNHRSVIHERRGIVLTKWRYDSYNVAADIIVPENSPYIVEPVTFSAPYANTGKVEEMKKYIVSKLKEQSIERKSNSFVIMTAGSRWSVVEPDGNIPYLTIDVPEMIQIYQRKR